MEYMSARASHRSDRVVFTGDRYGVKMGWLYANRGDYQGFRILSEDWVKRVLACSYEFHKIGSDWWGKEGMLGQMLCFSLSRKEAYAWQAYELTKNCNELIENL